MANGRLLPISLDSIRVVGTTNLDATQKRRTAKSCTPGQTPGRTQGNNPEGLLAILPDEKISQHLKEFVLRLWYISE